MMMMMMLMMMIYLFISCFGGLSIGSNTEWQTATHMVMISSTCRQNSVSCQLCAAWSCFLCAKMLNECMGTVCIMTALLIMLEFFCAVLPLKVAGGQSRQSFTRPRPRTNSALAYQISLKSGTAWLSYWWFHKVTDPFLRGRGFTEPVVLSFEWTKI